MRIDPIPAAGAKAGRYSTSFGTASPANEDDAVDLPLQYGKDIIDGKVQATEL